VASTILADNFKGVMAERKGVGGGNDQGSRPGSRVFRNVDRIWGPICKEVINGSARRLLPLVSASTSAQSETEFFPFIINSFVSTAYSRPRLVIF
jgi:hypothetical protein